MHFSCAPYIARFAVQITNSKTVHSWTKSPNRMRNRIIRRLGRSNYTNRTNIPFSATYTYSISCRAKLRFTFEVCWLKNWISWIPRMAWDCTRSGLVKFHALSNFMRSRCTNLHQPSIWKWWTTLYTLPVCAKAIIIISAKMSARDNCVDGNNALMPSSLCIHPMQAREA